MLHPFNVSPPEVHNHVMKTFNSDSTKSKKPCYILIKKRIKKNTMTEKHRDWKIALTKTSIKLAEKIAVLDLFCFFFLLFVSFFLFVSFIFSVFTSTFQCFLADFLALFLTCFIYIYFLFVCFV